MTRIALTELDFDNLTSGQIVEQDGVEIILKDIGYDRMISLLEVKKIALGNSMSKPVEDIPEDPAEAMTCDSCQ